MIILPKFRNRFIFENMETKSKWNILVVDDNEDILLSLRLLLSPFTSIIRTSSNPGQLKAFLKSEQYDAILLDMNFTRDAISGSEGLELIGEITAIDPDVAIICITAYGDTEQAVKAIKAGATDFVLKPWNNDKLIATIDSSVRLCKSKLETKRLKDKQEELNNAQHNAFDNFIGESAGMKAIFETIEHVSATDASVLILGENGTGKELVARSIHKLSNRKDEIFVSVDLGALNENLFEAELFGYVKGAYTDAKKDKAGKFEIADSGTIFLDEIGNLSPAMQAKLLTVLERREVCRLGSNKTIPLDVRVISATNAKLSDLIAEGNFREDLYYRINTLELDLPPLRDRKDDIQILSVHFLEKFSAKYNKKYSGISKDALSKLKSHSWPGNVRELSHVMERAVIMSRTGQFTADDFLLKAPAKTQSSSELPSYNLDEIEKTVIEKVIEIHSGNMSKVAKELGISRAALYRRMEKFDL